MEIVQFVLRKLGDCQSWTSILSNVPFTACFLVAVGGDLYRISYHHSFHILAKHLYSRADLLMVTVR